MPLEADLTADNETQSPAHKTTVGPQPLELKVTATNHSQEPRDTIPATAMRWGTTNENAKLSGRLRNCKDMIAMN